MNLINFHKYEKNKKYIKDNKIMCVSQGIYHSYWIMPNGNGFNRYIFTVKKKSTGEKEHKITIDEKYIINWEIASQHSEDVNKPYIMDYIEFDAVGLLESGEYIRLGTNGCHDYNILNKELEIVDITVTNDNPEEPLLNISNAMQFCEEILEPRQKNCSDILSFQNRTSKNMIEYDDLFNKIGERLRFVVDDTNVIILEIVKITKSATDGDDIMDAYIYKNFDKIYVENIKLRHILEIDDDHDISLDMMINGENYYDFGYIAEFEKIEE